MAEYALSNAPYPGVNTPYRRGVLLPVVLTSNGSTVSIDEARSASGFSITTGANGALTGVAPSASRGVLLAQTFVPTAANEVSCTVVAFDPVTGAFTLQVHNGTTESILASGNELWLLFMLEGG